MFCFPSTCQVILGIRNFHTHFFLWWSLMQATTFSSTLIFKVFPVDVVCLSKLCPAGVIGGCFDNYGIIRIFFKLSNLWIGKIKLRIPLMVHKLDCYRCWISKGCDIFACCRAWLGPIGVLCQALVALKTLVGRRIRIRTLKYNRGHGYYCSLYAHLQSPLAHFIGSYDHLVRSISNHSFVRMSACARG